MYCLDCGRQEEFCHCPMRRRDVVVVLVVFAAMLAYTVWSSLRPPVQAIPAEHGYRPRPPAVRQIPSPRPRARA